MIEIDHVIMVVADLERSARELRERHGLRALSGGRHPGHGTGNRIVPLGSTYLELMAVVDAAEATGSPMGRWAARQTRIGLHPVALCLRTTSIAEIGASLGETPLAMSRQTPDGDLLSWRLVGLDGMIEKGDPFFIQWDLPPDKHPGAGAVDHDVAPHGIQTVRHGWPSGPLGDLLGEVPDLVLEDGVPGVHSLTVATASGSMRLPSDR